MNSVCEAAPLVVADVWVARVTGLNLPVTAQQPTLRAGAGSALQLSWWDPGPDRGCPSKTKTSQQQCCGHPVPVHPPPMLHTLHEEPDQEGEGAWIHGSVWGQGWGVSVALALAGKVHAGNHCSWGRSCASRAMGSFCMRNSVPGAGSCCWHHTPCCSTYSLEPLLRRGTKDRKYSSGQSKAPTLQVLSVGGTLKGLQRASCRPVVFITGWSKSGFLMCVSSICSKTLAVKPLLAVVGCVLPCFWL